MRWGWTTLASVLVSACGGEPAPEEPAPFPEDTDDGPSVTATSSSTSFPLDTGFTTPEDGAPDHVLHVTQMGQWTMSGSPYSSVGGTVRITELVDATLAEALLDTAIQPECDLVFTMTGAVPPVNTGCPCDAVFDVSFFLSAGDPSACRSTDLPFDGASWRMGWSEADQMIYWDYRGTGVYVPWWPGQKVGDTVTFTWAFDLGVEIEEEE